MKAILRVLFKIFLVLFTVASFMLAAFLSPWGERAFYPMHFAVRSNMPTLVYILSFTPLKDQSFTPLKEIWCQSPLTLAAQKGHIEIMGILLDQGADPDLCGSFFLSISNKPEIVRYLFEERKIFDTRPDYRSKAFEMIKCRSHLEDERARNSAESLRVFLDNGTDPNMTRHDPFLDMDISLLTEAKRSGCTLHSALLLKYGADEGAAEATLGEIQRRKALKRSKAAVRGVSAEFARKEKERQKALNRSQKAARGLSWKMKRRYKNPLVTPK